MKPFLKNYTFVEFLATPYIQKVVWTRAGMRAFLTEYLVRLNLRPTFLSDWMWWSCWKSTAVKCGCTSSNPCGLGCESELYLLASNIEWFYGSNDRHWGYLVIEAWQNLRHECLCNLMWWPQCLVGEIDQYNSSIYLDFSVIAETGKFWICQKPTKFDNFGMWMWSSSHPYSETTLCG